MGFGFRQQQAGQKRPAPPSQSPAKAPPKVQRQREVQYRLAQEDLQPLPTRLFLPSAPMGAPRAPETSKRSLEQARAERQNLAQEVRASEELYHIQGAQSQLQLRLQQPVQPAGRTDEPVVPHV